MPMTPAALYLRDNSTCNAVSFIGSQLSNTTLNVSSVVSGALAAGMFYTVTAATPSGVIVSGSGSTWTSTSSAAITAGTAITAMSAFTPGTVGWSAVPGWVGGHTYTAGQLVRQSANACVFTGSTTGSSATVAVSSITSGKLVAGQQVWYTGGQATILSVNADPATSITLTGAITLTSQLCVASFPPLSQRVFACVVGGVSQALEPAWTITRGAKTTETGGVAWIEVSGHPALNGDTVNSGTWVASTAPGLGAVIVDAAKAYVFVCSTNGTTKAGAEPAWNTTTGGTTTDNAATWTCLGPVSNFPAWSAPHGAFYYTIASGYGLAGQTVFAASDHNELFFGALIYGAAASTVASPTYVLSVDPTTGVPPAVLSPGATTGTIGPWSITATSTTAGWYFNGFTMQGGSGGGASLALGAAKLVMDGCTLAKLSASGSVSAINFSGNCDALLNNPTFRLGSVTDRVAITGNKLRIQNMSTPLAGSIVPNVLFGPAGGNSLVEIDGSDFTALGSGQIINSAGWVVLSGNKLGSATVITGTPTAAQQIDVLNCDSAASDYLKARYGNAGTQTTETAVTRTGGAAVDVTAVSDKIVSNANASWLNFFPAIPIGDWNSTVGSAVTVTIYGISNAAALPNNDEVWLDVEYSSSASSPIAATATSTKTSPIATATAAAADTSAWDAHVTARANGATYSVGQAIKVASNAGRVFFCTTAGNAGSAEPAGYASAVDGGTVNESTGGTGGTAVFRAGQRFKLALAVTPQLPGPIYARPKAGKPSATVYLDPLITLT